MRFAPRFNSEAHFTIPMPQRIVNDDTVRISERCIQTQQPQHTSLEPTDRKTQRHSGWKLLFILCIVIAITSATSHFAVRRLGIYSNYSLLQTYGPKNKDAVAILDGSSLSYSGIDWNRISVAIGGPIRSLATAGSSPAEWEIQHRQSPAVPQSFIGISAYDLNEYWLCDFRADIVPFFQTIRDLRQLHADWPFSKRVLSQYAVMLVRKAFPTVGRSDGVMTGVRDMLQHLVHGDRSGQADEGTMFGASAESQIEERVSDWSPARLQRRLVLMRMSCQDHVLFDGLKKIALIRLLQQANNHGNVTLIVFPVSPIYQEEFLGPSIARNFERAIADLRTHFPTITVVRLDKLPALADNTVFRDIVHLNRDGRRIATASFLESLRPNSSRR